MRYTILLFLVSLVHTVFAQNTSEDSALFYQQIDDLVQQKQYATTHLLLLDRMQREGVKTQLVCRVVDNALSHYYKHDKFEIFYLRDRNNGHKQKILDTLNVLKIAKLRYPLRWLKRISKLNPQSGWTKKLMGDYYRIQLQNVENIDLVSDDKKLQIREKVFTHYSQAEQLEYQNAFVFRWLGVYKFKTNQIEEAESYFVKTLEINAEDPFALYYLAKISSQNKQFSQTLNYAKDAIQHLSSEQTFLRYQAVLLAAESLRELGEINKFLYYTNEAIKLIPDEQSAYLILHHYYRNQKKTEKAEDILAQMLLQNPFELKGYRVIESYVLQNESFYFGDKLFDQMLMKYENWDEVLANIYWSKGNLAYRQGLTSEAKKFWDISRNYMKNYLPEEDPLIKKVGSIMSNN